MIATRAPSSRRERGRRCGDRRWRLRGRHGGSRAQPPWALGRPPRGARPARREDVGRPPAGARARARRDVGALDPAARLGRDLPVRPRDREQPRGGAGGVAREWGQARGRADAALRRSSRRGRRPRSPTRRASSPARTSRWRRLGASTELDRLTMAERLAATEMDASVRALTEALWSLHFHCPLDRGALTQGLRWVALAAWSSELLDTACATYKIDGGTTALLAGDPGRRRPDRRPYERRRRPHRPGGRRDRRAPGLGRARDRPRGGRHGASERPEQDPVRACRSARRSRRRRTRASRRAERRSGSGCAGTSSRSVLMADVTHPLVWVQSEHWVDGDSILVGFGISSGAHRRERRRRRSRRRCGRGSRAPR